MNLSLGAGGAGSLTVLCEDGERVLCRGWHDEGSGDRTAVLAVFSASEHPTPSLVARLAHDFRRRASVESLLDALKTA